MEFPRAELEQIARECRRTFIPQKGLPMASSCHAAIKAYDELADRLLRERLEWSIQIANYRARLREIDPAFPKDTDPHQLSIDA